MKQRKCTEPQPFGNLLERKQRHSAKGELLREPSQKDDYNPEIRISLKPKKQVLQNKTPTFGEMENRNQIAKLAQLLREHKFRA